jgi:hypothetical protein
MTATPFGRCSVAELSAALRNGLHARRFAEPPPPQPPFPQPEPIEVAARLIPVSGLLGHRATARPSPLGPIIRFARRVAKGLMRPWLDLQTQFNHGAIGSLEDLQSRTSEDVSRLHQRCDGLQQALAQSAVAHQALAARVSECFEQLQRERAKVRRLSEELELRAEQSDSCTSRPAPIASSVIETVFVHTRLPAPPTRVLVIGGDVTAAALSLGVIGYNTVEPVTAPTDPLPYPEDAFDAVVAMGWAVPSGTSGASQTSRRIAGELFRVVRSGGRAIFTLPAPQTEALAALLSGWRTVEQAWAIPTASGWRFTAGSAAGPAAVALVVVEKN